MPLQIPRVFFGNDANRGPGSIACLVRAPDTTGPLYILSAAHVLAPLDAPDYRTVRGTLVQCVFGNGQTRRVGSLLDWTPVQLADSNAFDAAIAEVDGDVADALLRSVPLPTGVTYAVEENWGVCALGAKTGVPKRGHVKQKNATLVSLRYYFSSGIREARYDASLHFTTDEISQVGDSGAAAIDPDGRLMGLLVGGSSSERCSYFVKAKPVLDRFGVVPVLLKDFAHGTSAAALWGQVVSTPTPADPLTETIVDVLARTLWGEARSEGRAGMAAVANVVRNRAFRGERYWWGGNIVDVCKMPYQFSCWNKNDPNRIKLLLVDNRDVAFRACLEVAAAAVADSLGPDATERATHYHTLSVSPKWARGKTPCARIGSHLFYNNIE